MILSDDACEKIELLDGDFFMCGDGTGSAVAMMAAAAPAANEVDGANVTRGDEAGEAWNAEAGMRGVG
jgi:hypothetical protein